VAPSEGSLVHHMSAEDKKALQAEVVAVKQRWSDEVKLLKAAKDAPNYPMPLAVARTIPRPDIAYPYDVDELTIRLWIDAFGEGADGGPMVRVEAVAAVPDALTRRMAEHIDARWRVELGARGSGKGWLLEKVLAWAEGAFIELVTLEPTFLDSYEGCNDEGMTIRRYAIIEPPPPPDPNDDDDDDDEDDDDDDDDEDDLAEAVKGMSVEDAEAEKLQRIKMKALEEADRRWREERRAEAERLGDDYGGPKPVSKKEQQKLLEEKRDKAGARLRKAGAKHNKFDAEAAGKKANKKNGLLH